MRRIISTVIMVMAVVAASFATTVTGTVHDSNSNAYANGTVSAYVGSGPISYTIPTDGSGAFAFDVPPNSYLFTVCAAPVNIGPLSNATPKQICFTSTAITVSGSSQSVSAQLNAIAPILGPGGSSSGGSGGSAGCNVHSQSAALDLGAKINACAAAIGFTTTTVDGFIAKYIGSPGTIRVDSVDAGPIVTQAVIPSNQNLSIGNGHYTNAFGSFIPPIVISDNSTVSCDSWGAQIDNTSQFVGANPVIGMANTMVCSSGGPPPCTGVGCQVNCSFPPTVGVTINGCHFKQSAGGSRSGTSLTGTIALAQCQGCKVTNNFFEGIGSTAITLVGTFTAFPTHPEWSYIFGHDDEISGNLIDGPANAGISVINNQNVLIHHNVFRNHFDGAAAYIDMESNSPYDYMQFIDVHDNLFDCSNPPAGPSQCYGVTMQSTGPNVGHIKLHDNVVNGPLFPVPGYLISGIGGSTFGAHAHNNMEVYNNHFSYLTSSAIFDGGGDYDSIHGNHITCSVNGGIQLNPQLTNSVIADNNFFSPPLTSFTITSVATSADLKSTVYTGTFTGGAANGLANLTFAIAGFPTNPTNNGTFGAIASTATTLTLNNGFGVSETHAATATYGCSPALTGSQNYTKIYETDTTDDFNAFKGNIGAGQIIKYGVHSQILDIPSPDSASQTFPVPTGFSNPIPGGVTVTPITAPVLNTLGPTNVAICTSILAPATYFFIVTAVAPDGTQAPSNEVSAALGAGQCARLGWTYSVGAASYNIHRGTASGNELLMANVGQGTLGYADPGGQTPGAAVPTVNSTGRVAFNANLSWATGSGAPTAGTCTAANGGSLYTRNDGGATTTLYVCDNTSHTWTAK